MKNKGFTFLRTLGTYEYGFEISFRKNGKNIDFFSFYMEKNITVRGVQQGNEVILP
jgi:hypothetical protein